MARPRSPAELQELMTLGREWLDVTAERVRAIAALPPNEATEALEKYKVEIKRAYKRAALALHPDRTGGDEAKALIFAKVTSVYDEMMAARVVPRPLPMQPFVFNGTIRVVGTWRTVHATANTADTNSNTAMHWWVPV